MNTISSPSQSIVSQIQSCEPDANIRQWTETTRGGAQGDLLMVRLPDDFSFSGLKKVDVTQLVAGTSIGSRHQISLSDFDVFEPVNFGRIEQVIVRGNRCFRHVGYILCSKIPNGGVTHPEHAPHYLCGANVATFGQVDLQTMRRVED